MQNFNIGFIGGGNMARSLIGGLIANGFERDKISVTEPDEEKRARLAADFGIHTLDSNQQIAATADVLLLAVKPQAMKQVAEDIVSAVQQNHPLIISIAAGIRESDINRWLGGNCAIVRAMPNTPALVECSATALYANSRVHEQQREQAESVLRAVGLALWLDREEQMDAVTALSGSGPAYFLLIMEIMEQTAVTLGLDDKTARLLTLQTAFGTAKMALESNEDAATLRRRVTSPGGTTEQAIKVLEDGGLWELFHQALTAARTRSEELAKQLGEK